MKLLVNDKELANYLTTLIDFSHIFKELKMPETQTAEAIAYALTEKEKGKGKWQKKKHKIKDINETIREITKAF